MEELSELFKIVAEENKKKKLEIESLVGDSFETLFIEQLKPKKKKIIQKKIQEPQIVEVVEVKKDTLIEKSLGLLSEPSDTKHKNDPITPLDQKFATFDDLQKHYSTFLSRIQQQLSTLGGGGETQIRYLDDVVGVATNSSNYNSKFLQWDSSSNTAEFVNINSGNIVGIVTGYYGSFYDTTTQNAVGVNTYQPVTINTTDISNQVSIANSSHIVVANSGIYNIQFSLQIDKSQGSLAHVYIWLKKNGVDVPNSATELAVQGTNSEVVAAWNFVVSASANDYYELMWSSTDDHIQIKARTASGVVPAIPSIILTVVSV
jgi:hypothetical protein